MGQIFRLLGLLSILGGIVLLLVKEKVQANVPVAPTTLMVAGAAAFVVGIVFDVISRARAAVVRRKCARCSRPVEPGEVYCTEHFRESIDRYRDSQKQ